jgi:hypothetical protein
MICKITCMQAIMQPKIFGTIRPKGVSEYFPENMRRIMMQEKCAKLANRTVKIKIQHATALQGIPSS